MSKKGIVYQGEETYMKILIRFFLLLIAVIILYPIYTTLLYSFMGVREIELNIGGIISGYQDMASPSLLPSYPTLSSYKEFMLYADQYYRMFWNSCLYAVVTVFGQLVIAAPAAFFLARYKFRGKQIILWIYLCVMLMPFQVVMVSEYLILHKLEILNTPFAIILPGIFGTYPVFILTKVFGTISEEVIEAAKIDGAGKCKIFMKICLPIGKGGMMSVAVLGFLEFFNILEQPMIFLENQNLWPLSLFFPQISLYNAGEIFAASILTMIPAVFVFFLGSESLEQGIKAFEVKR